MFRRRNDCFTSSACFLAFARVGPLFTVLITFRFGFFYTYLISVKVFILFEGIEGLVHDFIFGARCDGGADYKQMMSNIFSDNTLSAGRRRRFGGGEVATEAAPAAPAAPADLAGGAYRGHHNKHHRRSRSASRRRRRSMGGGEVPVEAAAPVAPVAPVAEASAPTLSGGRRYRMYGGAEVPAPSDVSGGRRRMRGGVSPAPSDVSGGRRRMRGGATDAAPVAEAPAAPAAISGGSIKGGEFVDNSIEGGKDWHYFRSASPETRAKRLKKKCPEGSARSEVTGRCRKSKRHHRKHSTLSRAIREGQALFKRSKCPKGEQRSRVTGHCHKK